MPECTGEKRQSPLPNDVHVIFFVLFISMKAAIDRLYYSITDVSKMIGEEQHVLRYWEREFPQLRPQKNRAGNRVYADKDLQVLRVIKRLLREERYTVAGAKEYLRTHGLDLTDLPAAPDVAVADGGRTPQGVEPNQRERTARELAAELRSIAGVLRQQVGTR